MCLDPNKEKEGARDNKGDGCMGRDVNEKCEKEARDHDTERHGLGSCDLGDERERGDKELSNLHYRHVTRKIQVQNKHMETFTSIGTQLKGPVLPRSMIDLVGPFSAAYGIYHTGGGGVSKYALSYVLARAYCACGSSVRQAREIVVSGGAVAVPQKSHHSQVPC